MEKNMKDELFAGKTCSWKLVSRKTCGCETVKSNKNGHYFADSCDICTNLPMEWREKTMNEELKEQIQKLREYSRKDLSPSDKVKMTFIKNIAQSYDIEALAMLVSMAWVCGDASLEKIATVLNENETVQ